MKSNYKKLGQFIERCDEKNDGNVIKELRGISNQKYFQKSKTNTIGVNLSKYRIVRRGQFAFNRATTRNGDKISIALRQGGDCIVSPSYRIFKSKDENILNSEYLMMWFRRPEFDRYARFKSHGSAHEFFDYDEMCEVELPVPKIEKQRVIVKEYNTVVNRIKLNEQLNQKLEETAQALYKHWFVDFEFPCLPSDYRPHGQVNLKISDEALRRKIANVCTYKRTGCLPISDGRTWYVYLILCDDDSIYKGITNDLHRRFYEHYTGGGAQHTQQHKPVKIIHWEAFDTRAQAAKREKDLKTGYGRTWISRQIEKAGGLTAIKTGSPAPQTALRTAGEMVYNEELDQEIPEGWCDTIIKEFGEIITGKTPSSNSPEDFGSDFPFVTPSDFNEERKFIYSTSRGLSNVGHQKLINKCLKESDVIVTCIGSDMGKVGLAMADSITNQQMNSISVSKTYYSDFLYYYFKDFKEELKQIAMGSSTMPMINKSEFEILKIIKPDSDVLERFERFNTSINSRLISYYKETNSLIQLKDLLLSKMTRIEEEYA